MFDGMVSISLPLNTNSSNDCKLTEKIKFKIMTDSVYKPSNSRWQRFEFVFVDSQDI